MKKIIASIAVLLVSVISVNVFAAQPTSVDQDSEANLVIYRPFDGSGINYPIALDGKRLGKLKRKSQMSFQLAAGEHVISVNDRYKTKLTVSVADTGVSYVKGSVDRRNRLRLTLSDADTMAADQ